MKNLPLEYSTKPGIYYIRHIPTNQYYVGSSNKLGQRTAQHNRRLVDNRNGAFNPTLQELYSNSKDDEWRLGVFESYNATEEQKKSKEFKTFLRQREAHFLSKVPFKKRLNLEPLKTKEGIKVPVPNKKQKVRAQRIAVGRVNYKGKGKYDNPLHTKKLRREAGATI